MQFVRNGKIEPAPHIAAREFDWCHALNSAAVGLPLSSSTVTFCSVAESVSPKWNPCLWAMAGRLTSWKAATRQTCTRRWPRTHQEPRARNPAHSARSPRQRQSDPRPVADDRSAQPERLGPARKKWMVIKSKAFGGRTRCPGWRVGKPVDFEAVGRVAAQLPSPRTVRQKPAG